jgi:hypothetical protein
LKIGVKDGELGGRKKESCSLVAPESTKSGAKRAGGKESEGVEEVLDEIGEVYKDFIVERSPIELVNYHENCPL